MSSRALRKAQRQLEEQQAIQEAKQLERSEDDEKDVEDEPAPVIKKSAFAYFDQEDEDEDDHEGSQDDEAAATSAPAEVKSTKVGKKKKKKARAAAKGRTVAKASTKEDDIDAVLRSLDGTKQSSKDRTISSEDTGNPAMDPKVEEICRLLSITTQHLHVRNEMRQLFGREAIEADRRPAQEQRRRGQRGAQQPTSQGFPALSLRRNLFITGKEEWPRATTGGLGMEIVSNQEDGTIEYCFVHSTAYQDAQRQYEIAVASMDPQRLVVLMHQNPYHIATLLQISEIAKHEGSHAESGDLLEKALFSFGRAVHSTFAHNLAQGKARLNFNRPENREFFLAIWRYIQNLTMRSTWRTVYEWAKMLLSLEPELDPYRMELVLDQYALRARQPQHYLDLLNTKFFKVNWHADHIPWSVSLAYLQTDQPEKAREELLSAIQTQPWVCVNLYNALDLEPIPPALWSYHEPPTPRHVLFIEMYCSRAKELWNTPEAKSLLSSVAAIAKPAVDQTKWQSNTTVAEARHVHLTQNDVFVRLLAGCAKHAGSGGRFEDADQFHVENLGRSPNTDPFPPSNNILSYDPAPPVGLHGVVVPGLENLGPVHGAELRRLMEEIGRLQTRTGVEHDVDHDEVDDADSGDNWDPDADEWEFNMEAREEG
jgi:hypothetical protein